MRSTRSCSGQHVVQGVAHRSLLLRVERVHGAHQNFERIARNRFMTFVRQAKSNASPILPNHYSSVRHDYNLAAAGAQIPMHRAAFGEIHGPILAGSSK